MTLPTSYRHLIDVKTTLCVYWISWISVTVTGLLVCPSTLLCFLCSYGYRISLSHTPTAHPECFPIFLVQLMMFRIIVQIQSRQISLGQILCGVKKQILMLFNGKVKHFSYLARVRFRLKGNNKPNSVSKRDIQCGS